jgi:hypothetical protein
MATTASTNISVIAASTAQPWRGSPTARPKAKAQRRGDQEDRQHLKEVAQRRRVFIRVGRVGIEEAAAVGAQHLDGLLRSDRAHGQGLLVGFGVFHDGLPLSSFRAWPSGAVFGHLVGRGLQRGHLLVAVEVLDHALPHEEDREHQRQRQQQPGGDARHVHPEVADGPSPARQNRGTARTPRRCRWRRRRKFCTDSTSICVR